MKTLPSAIALLCVGLSFPSLPGSAQADDAAAYTFTTLAGYAGTGSADGVSSDAQFNGPTSVAADSAGNVYVADTLNYTLRKISPAGEVSTIAGFPGSRGVTDGANSGARFFDPWSLAVDTVGNIYVADAGGFAVRKVAPVGTNWVVSTIASFEHPTALAVDGAGNLYVADHSFRIWKVTPDGTNWVVSSIAGQAGVPGSSDGMGTNATFGGRVDNNMQPLGLAVDNAGNVYVADTWSYTIRKIAPVGTNWLVTTLAGSVTNSGSADGTNGAARFNMPCGLAADSAGNIYVADLANQTVRKITPAGTNWVVTTLAGHTGQIGTADGTGTNAFFWQPQGVAADNAGNIFVADHANNSIRQITSARVVSTLAGATSSQGSANGSGSNARFNQPRSVAVGNGGTLYVADLGNMTIRKITAAGAVSTIAGLAGVTGSADGAGSDARFDLPYGVVVDGAGNVFVADLGNATIRRITPAGMVSTIAGLARNYAITDGAGSQARFYYPTHLVMDRGGNLYVSDRYTVRKVTPEGTNWVVSTIAGQAGVPGSADGLGTNAQFGAPGYGGPTGLAVDGATNLFAADFGNHTIRKLTPVGANWVVSTIAGSAGSSGGTDGAGTDARFRMPEGVAVDSSGNVFVAEYGNSTVRKLTPVGTNWVVSTIGGVADQTGSADGAGRAARFNRPCDIAVDGAGTVYVADTLNNTIRAGLFTAYTATNPVPCAQPAMDAQLQVTLLPPEAGGQWRFAWELGWHSSGELVSSLVAGNYPIEFRDPPGYLAYPPTVTATVTNGGTTRVTNQYYPTFNLLGTTNTGALTVNIGPAAPSGAGWRFLGETAWRTPGFTANNLLPDTYAIEFNPLDGYSKPASQAVQVSAGTTAVIWGSYLLAQSAPSGVCLPVPVPGYQINDLANYPYGFNGQLQSETGYGSGVAVQTNVVLTVAHLVFNDQNLSYARQVYWRFRQEAGLFAPQPQPARGWYVLAGYAAQRTNDLLGGLGPDRSSPQSRNLDVAALYFPSPVAGGGYGGYLPSDTRPNLWLTGTSLKLLVGYPVDGSLLGDASIVPGRMYQTGPQPYPLTLATDPVDNQQVYLAPWFLSYPGNSGGPLYVQFNGYYYPAGVYLGTLYNGIVPYASLVRGIDSNVVNLITGAQALGDSGTNGTGGGVITITVGGGSGGLAYLQVNLGPTAAVAAGAAWRLAGTTTWCGNSPFTITVPQGGSATLEFKSLPGWNLPPAQALTLTLGQLTTTSVLYEPTAPLLSGLRLLPNGALAMTLNGAVGRTNAILSSGNLLTPLANWTELLRLTNTTGQTTFTNPPPATTPQYYRAKQL